MDFDLNLDNNNVCIIFCIIVVLIVVFCVMRGNRKRMMWRRRYGNGYNHENYFDNGAEMFGEISGQSKSNDGTYNPYMMNPEMNAQADKDNFIVLPTKADYPFAKSPKEPWDSNALKYGEIDGLDDGANHEMDINYSMCSKSCCGNTTSNWPTPVHLQADDFVTKSGKKFVASNYTCNNGWQDTGCLCLEDKTSNFLLKRGGNSYRGNF